MRLALLALTIGLVALPGSVRAHTLADPIVGFWNFSGGVVQVTGSGTSFTGIVVKPTRFSVCTHPAREVIWRLTKSGSGYTGTHEYFDTATCVPGSGGRGAATWSIGESGGRPILHFCSTDPAPEGATECDDLTRAVKLVLHYEMPRRYGLDANKDRLVDYYTTAAQVSPREWTALITVDGPGDSECDPSATYTWTIDGKARPFVPKGNCVFAFEHFPHQGKYEVAVTATAGDVEETGTVTVVLKDYLIFGLGDSNGSGEGNPDLPGVASPLWENFRCHRSAQSFQARTALALEQASPQASVTFVHLACSGASIPQGMTGPYGGVNDPGGAPIASQVAAMGELRGKRPVDAVLVSIGVNDLGFGAMVAFCIEHGEDVGLSILRDKNVCFVKKGVDEKSPAKTLATVVEERLASLPGRYDNLAAAFTRQRIPPKSIYITQYFDSTRDSDGTFCNPLISVVGTGNFTKVEAEWAFEHFLVPLNAAIAAAAKKHGWQLVSGAQRLFRMHGYCSDDPWIVHLTESLWKQGLLGKGVGAAKSGTLHANAAGHQSMTTLVRLALQKDRIDGMPR